MTTYVIDFSDPLRAEFTIAPGSFDGPGGSTSSTNLRLYGRGALEWGESVDEDLVRLLENFAGATPPLMPTAGQFWFNQKLYWRNTLVAVTDGTYAGLNAFYRHTLPPAVSSWSPTNGTSNPFQVWVIAGTIISYGSGSAVGDYVWSIADNKLYRWDSAYKQAPVAWMERTATVAAAVASGNPSQQLLSFDQFSGPSGAFSAPSFDSMVLTGSPTAPTVTPPSTSNLVIANTAFVHSAIAYDLTLTPAIGTPSSIILTNATGTAAGLTAGNVTTNANLTGPITSIGNATSIALQTGTGTTFVVSVGPTISNAGLTGTPTAPTAPANTNTTQIASTAYVDGALANPPATVPKIWSVLGAAKNGDIGVVGSVISMYAGGAWHQIFPAVYS